ncbi:MAG: T9SS type A sorting domain-containing protein [Bacteroidales bacterium]|nr:T9SS type A sorting domain-containing protein [Bacteroidales bacterium]
MEIFYYCEGYQDKRWGVAFPIIGFRCGPIQQLFLDAYTGDSAVVRWRQVEEGTLYNVRLTGEDGSDTAFVISDTTYTFTPLSDSVRYTAMVRKQCHYATSNYDTTVYGEWKTVSFGTTIIDTTIADTTGVDTVGIARPEVEGFSLVPNPTNGAVLLTTEAEMTGVEVYTAAGVPFLHLPASGRTVRFDTSTWPAGTYLLTVSTSQGIITRRLTVIR